MNLLTQSLNPSAAETYGTRYNLYNATFENLWPFGSGKPVIVTYRKDDHKESMTSYNKIEYLVDGPKKSDQVLIIAHGAGAPMDSDWMNDVASQISAAGIKTVRFEFPYMVERRESGKKRPPNTKKVMLETWHQVVSDWSTEQKIYLSGKSMGGRMASLMIDEVCAAGLICFGFPFHAPGKPPKDRLDHLKNLRTKTLIIQGERDSMGNRDEVSEYEVSKKIKFHWLEDGDHSFKPRKKSGFTQEEHVGSACQAAIKFMSC